MKKLRIAQFVTSETPFPIPKDFPRPYAPITVALDISNGLTDRGHEVLFFGPRGSSSRKFKAVPINFAPLYKNKIFKDGNMRGTEREKIFNLFDQYVISEILKFHKKKPFDVIHIHPLDRALPMANVFSDAKFVYTLHDPLYEWRAEIFRMFNSKNQYFVSISNAQRKPAPDLNYGATVYNAIDVEKIPFSSKQGKYLFFSGRLQDNKGVSEAIAVAKKTKMPLFIAGAPAHGDYWDKEIKPHLNKNIKYVGFVTGKKLYDFYKNAQALLFPIKWEEPFGLVMIEAMACGTPVIAFNRGSVSEVIKNKKTGFIVRNIKEMSEAVRNLDSINRADCREHVKRNFNVDKMVDGYEKLFLKISGK